MSNLHAAMRKSLAAASIILLLAPAVAWSNDGDQVPEGSMDAIAALTLAGSDEASPTLGEGRTRTVPLKIRGGGVVAALPLEGPEPWFAVGTATHLGKYRVEGGVQIDALTSPTTADFSNVGPAVFTGANGDELHMEFAGEITIFEDGSTLWIATFRPLPGSTGRFEKVCGGSLIMTAHGAPVGEDGSVHFRWRGLGTLEVGK